MNHINRSGGESHSVHQIRGKILVRLNVWLSWSEHRSRNGGTGVVGSLPNSPRGGPARLTDVNRSGGESHSVHQS
ncbi:MAG: hypothetical protein GX870_06130 [Candidatus Marinimicrobia bacterium]|nr:hypothetical protein [Candidatus Neomarinimicrobiota bacterium]